jgi:hypothetical protein
VTGTAKRAFGPANPESGICFRAVRVCSSSSWRVQVFLGIRYTTWSRLSHWSWSRYRVCPDYPFCLTDFSLICYEEYPRRARELRRHGDACTRAGQGRPHLQHNATCSQPAEPEILVARIERSLSSFLGGHTVHLYIFPMTDQHPVLQQFNIRLIESSLESTE